MTNIKVFKMISGEEIIGEVIRRLDDSLEMKKPATIILQQTAQGVGVGLAPYMPYASGNIYLMRNAIASEADVETNMVNEYNRVFGSGIQIVPSSALPVAK